MMYRLIRWLLHKFNYELVHLAELERLKRIERNIPCVFLHRPHDGNH